MKISRLSVLFLVNGIFTLIGSIILFFMPSLIFGVSGIQLTLGTNFIVYLLGATSVSLSILSFYAAYLLDKSSIKGISITFFVFHLTTGIIGIFAIWNGLSSLIWGSIFIHFFFALSFLILGVLNNSL